MPRLDVVLTERGLAESRARAQALVMAGLVTVDGAPAAKAGQQVGDDADLHVVAPPRFVSRGGEKLETMLVRLGWDVTGADALDLGASTGGFSDCLLQRGAARVVALDVGYGQLHQRVRDDPRVTVIERTNARALEAAALPFRPDLLVADLSFISLRLVLPAALPVLRSPWRAIVLVKPQFEAGRADVARGGVVRDDAVRARAIVDVARLALELGAAVVDAADSEHPGPAGNREYLLALASPELALAAPHAGDLEALAAQAVARG